MATVKLLRLWPALLFACSLVASAGVYADAPTRQALSDLQAAGKLRLNTWIEPAQAIVVNQQISLLIEIATDQWFSGGTRIGRLELEDAIVLRRERFAVNSTRREQGKSWTVQRWRISIYPQRAGRFEIPPLRLALSVVGDEGKPVSGELLTEPLGFKATVPEALRALAAAQAGAAFWVASPAFSVTEHYSQSRGRELQQLRPGDAVRRRIEFKAENVAAMMLPALTVSDQQGLAVYHRPPRLSDDINRGTYLAQRVENHTYVIEKPGSYLLPQVSFLWWDLSAGALKTLSLPAQQISTDSAAANGRQTTQRFADGGWLRAVLAVVPAVLLAGAGFYWWRSRAGARRKAKAAPGEHALRRKLLRACRQGDTAQAVALLYQWLDHYPNDRFHGSIRDFMRELNQQGLQPQFEAIMHKLYANASSKADADPAALVTALADELKQEQRRIRWRPRPVALRLN